MERELREESKKWQFNRLMCTVILRIKEMILSALYSLDSPIILVHLLVLKSLLLIGVFIDRIQSLLKNFPQFQLNNFEKTMYTSNLFMWVSCAVCWQAFVLHSTIQVQPTTIHATTGKKKEHSLIDNFVISAILLKRYSSAYYFCCWIWICSKVRKALPTDHTLQWMSRIRGHCHCSFADCAAEESLTEFGACFVAALYFQA